MLSPNYNIVRFKQTNVFLNRITIQAKIHQFDSAFTLKEGEEDEELFLIDHSVFDRYECEQPGYRTKLMDKCFETDLSYGKIYTKVCKGEDSLFKVVRAKLREHYEDIINVFIFLACRDDRACIGLNEFTSWISAISACDKALDMALVDRTFISTNIHDHSFFLNADRTLYRYEFLEIIVRLAKIKYNE